MNPIALLEKYFPDSRSFSIIHEHSALVEAKAAAIARGLSEPVDALFVEQAALLHDIGICRTFAPGIGCFGEDPYICHGIHGRMILESEGLPRHAMVCERHIGVGLTRTDITDQGLPLPIQDMAPTCVEEEIVCFADLFYSKKAGSLGREKSIESIVQGLGRFGQHKVAIFSEWITRFGNPSL